MHGLGWPIAFVVIIVVLGVTAKLLLGQKGKGIGSPYQKEPSLFSPAELAFLRVLLRLA